ncbi:MAG: hypothetical protein H6873_05660 [Hyphomicrobiaceae bacterium]|nr:hypothetical protein [Hyphomicrobiaceae bacterium]
MTVARIRRVLVWLNIFDGAGDPATFGFWNGDGPVTVTVPAAVSGSSVSRSYAGDQGLLEVPRFTYAAGLNQDSHDLKLDLTHSAIATIAGSYQLRGGTVEIHRGWREVDGSGWTATPELMLYGVIDEAKRDLGAAGSEASFTVTFLTNPHLGHSLSAMKSDQTQRQRSGDRFRRYSARAIDMPVSLGPFEKKKRR